MLLDKLLRIDSPKKIESTSLSHGGYLPGYGGYLPGI